MFKRHWSECIRLVDALVYRAGRGEKQNSALRLSYLKQLNVIPKA